MGHLEVRLCLGVSDVVVDGVEVVEGDEDEVLGVAAQQDLLLHRHHHQVVQLWKTDHIFKHFNLKDVSVVLRQNQHRSCTTQY